MKKQQLKNLADALTKRGQELSHADVVVGFDGFVDEIISLVEERSGLEKWSAVKDIGTFSKIVAAAIGKSSLREIVIHRFDAGGCSVNLGDGLAHLGVKLDCFATLGNPRHPAFDEFAGKCRSCTPWGKNYGRTLAFEFADGKFMFSAVSQLEELKPELLNAVLADGAYQSACSRAKLIAMTNWTLYPHMTSCWKKLQQAVYGRLSHRPFFFIDLVDPTGRSDDDVLGMLETVPGFEPNGPTVLGLNGNEANKLSRALKLPRAEEEIDAVKQQAVTLRKKLGISQVVIHAVKFAVVADVSGVHGVNGPFCANPKKLTGAGDRFNAGYCCGLILGLDPEQRLLLGSASSGFFVREARSAGVVELTQFVQDWAKAVS